MAKRTKRKTFKKVSDYPVIGKYIDTSTNTELDVVYFMDDTGEYKISTGYLPSIILKSCRIQFKSSDVKRKRTFYKKLQSFLDFSSGGNIFGKPSSTPLPLLFGLLKIRRGKQRKFVLVQSADQYVGSKVTNVVAVKIDNLLYLDLVNKLKNKQP